MAEALPKTYPHEEVERRWYTFWMEAGYFQPSRPGAPFFSIVIPPPNVTGSLHMGHALNNTLQDILCRYKRMDGFNVLWVPGTDHAGIATQNVVERQLAARGLNRTDLGREKFIEAIWRWRTEAGSTILNQLKALGVSCDWSRERFTMDEKLSRAVRVAFVRLWQDGLLYRAERLINWCPRCKTALADIEVVHEETEGQLWYLRYPLGDDPSRHVVVATTRPETMLGDTAIAVHPEDSRYHDIVGGRALLPIAGREIPVIADPFVDPAFGTGALKITPGHDFNDFEIAERHKLQRFSIFDEDARINPAAFGADDESAKWLEPYARKDRFEARELVVAELKERGLLEKVEPYRYAVGRCYRCQTVIEPFLTPQWFVKTRPLAENAIEVVREGRIRIIPEGWVNSYFAWMGEIKDWCVSRQIWWGHQIPAWYCMVCDAGALTTSDQSRLTLSRNARPIVQHEAPARCPRCHGESLVQDPDVLDTWFSSALWPFSTLGWPEETEDLKNFYPTSVLVTGFDILFFWVARMVMMGCKFKGEVPFRDVYIHALVRDQEGQKMSKSKGNVIDPLEVMGRYGTDAFRFTLAAMAAMGRDVKLSEDRIAGYQNFVNKLWNAARFALMNAAQEPNAGFAPGESRPIIREDLNLADRWILSRLARAVENTRKAMEGYRFDEMAQHLYQFTWHEFCDWYIEMSKLSLNGVLGDDPLKTKKILLLVLERLLRLLHPIMPFVTEEIWQAILSRDESRENPLTAGSRERQSIMIQPYPEALPEWLSPDVEEKAQFLMEAVRAIRNLRAEMNYVPGKEARIVLRGEEQSLNFLKIHEPYLRSLARLGSIDYLSHGEGPRGAAMAVVGRMEIYLPLADGVNAGSEKIRLLKEIAKFQSERLRIEKKLSDQQFLNKAKEEIVQKERQKFQGLEDKIQALNRSLERIEESQAAEGS